ncbi:hypothetical protein HK104_007287 [Borealophlyctis nickersoniae]|nr:hypothetical protein HK104_007287 [Borealophlyctis nickersoniae]
MVSTLETLWEALRRFRGAPPISAEKYFDKTAIVTYIPTGTSYTGLTQIEALLASLRETYMYVQKVDVLNTVYSSESATIIEETLWTLRHNRIMPWLAPGIKDTGEEVRFVMCTVTELNVESGKIERQRVYWDQANVLKQLRVLPTSVYNKRLGGNVELGVKGVEVVDLVLRLEGEQERAWSLTPRCPGFAKQIRYVVHGGLPPRTTSTSLSHAYEANRIFQPQRNHRTHTHAHIFRHSRRRLLGTTTAGTRTRTCSCTGRNRLHLYSYLGRADATTATANNAGFRAVVSDHVERPYVDEGHGAAGWWQ